MALPPLAWPDDRMTYRERFLATVTFAEADRLPFWELLGYEAATLRRWVREGLPEDVSLEQFFWLDRTEAVPVELGPMPPHRPGELPIASQRDFARIAAHYSCYSPARYPWHWDDCKRCWTGRDYPLRIELDGPLTWLGRWLGARADERGLANEALEFLTTYVTLTLERAVSEVDVDYVVIRERQSPAGHGDPALQQTLAGIGIPALQRLCAFFREHGIRIIVWCAGGDIAPIIPELVEAGVTGIMPCHAGAGMDVLAIAAQYPKLLIVGGLDVRQLARQRRHADREARIKIPAAMERGGWIPCFDEAIPATVPLRNYEQYWHVVRELLAARQGTAAAEDADAEVAT
jgi:hypothetical protein